MNDRPVMTDTLAPQADPTAERGRTADDAADAARRSRLWRTVWRTHFYAGIVVIPFIVVFGLTGLVILYTQPINDATRPDLMKVAPQATSVPLDTALANGVAAVGDEWHLLSVIPPRDDHHSVTLSLGDENEERFTSAFVDPYTGRVLGSDKTDGLPGLANRLHWYLNVDKTIKVPSIATLFDHSQPLLLDAKIGDLIMELAAGWALVLAASGLYLWWPRKRGVDKAMFVPRIAKRGRARWRDLHAIPMALFSVVLVWFVVTGMPWGSAWGPGWGAAAATIDAGTPFPEVASRLPNDGDLDRFGNPVPWALSHAAPVGEAPQSPHHHGESSGEAGNDSASDATSTEAAPDVMTYQQVAMIADEIGMQPGYSITPPVDSTDDAGNALYGTYQLNSPWPTRLSDTRTVFLDKFTGETVSTYTSGDWGVPAKITEFGIQVHMGTQMGLFNRMLMTAGCLIIIWGAFAALVMWWKRRPKGTLGLPRRPVDVNRAKGIFAIAVVLGIAYPILGASMILIGLTDRYLIRRIPRLRRAFGMR